MSGLRSKGKALDRMKRGIVLVAEQQAANRAKKPLKLTGLAGWLPVTQRDYFGSIWERLP